LNLLSPEPPPASPFEVMIVGGIGKTLLHQLLPAFAIAPCGPALGLGSG
jgi:hypothetical protein